ncbi:F-box only protein 30-like [Diadema setosum]|uniref:F-box only protein 30-like n=1 Tax=Diadema setosum TaxID=31175 RepID=UPI003B3BBF58
MVVEVEPDLPHGHCDACYDRHCSVSPQPGNACSLVNCDADCGARFHRCKAEDHRELCPNAKVECVNAIYGCPVEMQRRLICRHLEVCPASVINCTMEWNRWPVYASERQPQQPLQLVPDNYNQLDIALALRDQRMLTKSMRASKRTRQILTNALNRRHPAVPLSAQLTSNEVHDTEEERKELDNLLQAMQDEKEAADRERARTPPGLQRSICNELYRQNHDSSASNGVAYPYSPVAPPRDPFIHCSHCARRKERMERVLASHHAMQVEETGSESFGATGGLEGSASGDPSCADHKLEHKHHNGITSDPCADKTHFHNGKEEHVFMDINGELSPDILQPTSLNSTLSSEDLDMHTPAVFVTQSRTGDVSAAPTRGHSKPIIIQPPTVLSSSSDKSHRLSSSSNGSVDSRHSLSLDLSLESITRYQAKPDSMYTFLCAQEFRRDEYPYHFQNVHSDIHGGLNGWMEQRCPLAPYGCTYSQRRLFPSSRGAHIVHSENLESFGLCLDENVQSSGFSSGPAMLEESLCVGSMEEDTCGMPENSMSMSTVIPVKDVQRIGGKENDSGVHCNGLMNSSSSESSINVKDDREHDGLGTRMPGDNHSDECIPTKCNSDLDKDFGSGVNGLEDEEEDAVISMETSSKKSGVEVSSIPATSDPSASEREHVHLHAGDQSIDMIVNGGVQSIEKERLEVEEVEGGSHQDCLPSGEHSQGVSKETDHLSQLPFELLRYLLRFLDSFTINHVAMVSKLLRQVCCSLLEERGMVVLQWERHRGRWRTTMKVWHFSTAFTPVTSWGFCDNPPIAEHLKTCPFNIRNIAHDPVRVMGHDPTSVDLATPDEHSSDEKGKGPRGKKITRGEAGVDDVIDASNT